MTEPKTLEDVRERLMALRDLAAATPTPVETGGDLVRAVLPEFDEETQKHLVMTAPDVALSIMGHDVNTAPGLLSTITVAILIGRILGPLPIESEL